MASVIEQVPFAPYTGNGVATVYPYEFELLQAADMVVSINGVVQPSSLYVLNGVGVQAGGTVTFLTPPGNGTDVLLQRLIKLERLIDYQNNGDLQAPVLNLDFKRLWQAAQQLNAGSIGALRAPFPEVLDELPSALNRRGLQLLFHPTTGQPFLAAPVSGTAADVLLQLALPTGSGLSGFQHSVTGSVLRTALAKMRDDYSPLDADAEGDGTTDDSVAIQRAAASGRVVDLLGKTYRCVSKITFATAGTHFRNGCLLWDGPNTNRLADITANNVTFEDVIFDGNDRQPRYALVYVAADVRRPRFKRCSFRDLYGTATGSTLVNQMYGLNINPYGVVGFEIEGCEFYNLRKLNDGSLAPVTVGFGFVGGVCFNTEDGSDPAAAQPTPSQGIISGCSFDTIKTVLATGLSDNDVGQYDDGDGVRTIQGTGALRLYVDVTGCTFRNVSKRAVKLRASGGTFSDSTILASLGAYGMSTPIDLVNGCVADNIRLVTSAAMPVLKVATLANSGDTTNLPLQFGMRGITCGHAKVGIELTSAGAVPMSGMTVQSVRIGSCTDRAFVTTGTPPSTQSNMVIDDFQVVGSGNNCRAIQADGAADGTGGWIISGLVTLNADIKVAGSNNVLRNVRQKITSGTFAGFAANAALLEFGSGVGLGGDSTIEDVTIDALGLATGFLSASRTYLVLANLDSMTVKGFKLLVPDGLSNVYPHWESFGNDVTIDGFEYTGAGFCRQGHAVASLRWSVKNAVRKGNGACTVSFWTLNAASQFYEFDNITDFRPTTATSIVSVTATNGIATNVRTRSSHVTPAVSGVAKTANLNTF